MIKLEDGKGRIVCREEERGAVISLVVLDF